MNSHRNYAFHSRGFSLVEVVLALGVVGFAIVAILGVLPVGLRAGHSAQDESRAAQMAQAILAGLSAQKFDAVAVPAFAADGGQTSPVNFNLTTQTGTVDWRANNKGELFQPGGGAFLINAPSQPADNAETYAVTLRFDPAPAGYDSGYANFVTVSVAWPASAAAADQTRRSFMRVISRY